MLDLKQTNIIRNSTHQKYGKWQTRNAILSIDRLIKFCLFWNLSEKAEFFLLIGSQLSFVMKKKKRIFFSALIDWSFFLVWNKNYIYWRMKHLHWKEFSNWVIFRNKDFLYPCLGVYCSKISFVNNLLSPFLNK